MAVGRGISPAGSCFSYSSFHSAKEKEARASLVAQWLRICLPVQGTRVRALVGKIPHAAEQLGL